MNADIEETKKAVLSYLHEHEPYKSNFSDYKTIINYVFENLLTTEKLDDYITQAMNTPGCRHTITNLSNEVDAMSGGGGGSQETQASKRLKPSFVLPTKKVKMQIQVFPGKNTLWTVNTNPIQMTESIHPVHAVNRGVITFVIELDKKDELSLYLPQVKHQDKLDKLDTKFNQFVRRLREGVESKSAHLTISVNCHYFSNDASLTAKIKGEDEIKLASFVVSFNTVFGEESDALIQQILDDEQRYLLPLIESIVGTFRLYNSYLQLKQYAPKRLKLVDYDRDESASREDAQRIVLLGPKEKLEPVLTAAGDDRMKQLLPFFITEENTIDTIVENNSSATLFVKCVEIDADFTVKLMTDLKINSIFKLCLEEKVPEQVYVDVLRGCLFFSIFLRRGVLYIENVYYEPDPKQKRLKEDATLCAKAAGRTLIGVSMEFIQQLAAATQKNLEINISDVWSGWSKEKNERIDSRHLSSKFEEQGSERLRKERAARHFEGKEAQHDAVKRMKKHGFYGLFNVYRGGNSNKMVTARAAFVDLAL